ncbi:MAG TPA: hypothetical protein VG167_22690 [Verrucomicrobiae bacterium]|nr:hypothetical protein [Verrucomicrobiae bacterium]
MTISVTINSKQGLRNVDSQQERGLQSAAIIELGVGLDNVRRALENAGVAAD